MQFAEFIHNNNILKIREIISKSNLFFNLFELYFITIKLRLLKIN